MRSQARQRLGGAGRNVGQADELPGRQEQGAANAKGGLPDSFQLFLDAVARERLLSRAEETRLAHSSERGDRHARERLVTSNLRLVVSIAKRYQGLGVPLADLVQEGAIGLCRAVEGFDWRRGCRFSTYATWWITNAVQRGLASGGPTIRLPEHVLDLQRRVRVAEARLGHELGRQPTDAEIASRVDATEQQVRDAKDVAASTLVPYGGADETGLDTLPDSAPGPDAAAEASLIGEAVRRALSTLSARERAVIELRYGLRGEPACSPEVAARKLELQTRQVRVLERAALVRLAALRELHG